MKLNKNDVDMWKLAAHRDSLGLGYTAVPWDVLVELLGHYRPVEGAAEVPDDELEDLRAENEQLHKELGQALGEIEALEDELQDARDALP